MTIIKKVMCQSEPCNSEHLKSYPQPKMSGSEMSWKYVFRNQNDIISYLNYIDFRRGLANLQNISLTLVNRIILFKNWTKSR